MVSIGVLGGTFDPVHHGHLAVAREVKSQLRLDRVVFVPAGQPWLKSDRPVTPALHRFEMVRLAIAPGADFTVSRIELDRAGPSYTIDTITELRAGRAADDDLFFILGWDSLAQLPQWRQAARLVELCRLVAVPRPGSPPPDLAALEAAVPGVSQRVIVLDRPHVDISATDIRRRVARGLSIADLVPEPVERYIREHGLYLRGLE